MLSKGLLILKKIILTFILITTFLSGCSKMQKSPAVTAVTTGLSFNAEISTDDGVYNYSVKTVTPKWKV